VGSNPAAGVVSTGGSLYGTTLYTEIGGCGRVYELRPPATRDGAWTGRSIYDFQGTADFTSDGSNSVAPLTVGAGGALYGTTFWGGTRACPYNLGGGCGTVFQLTPQAAPGRWWTETVIYTFTGINGDGVYPAAGVVLGKNGVIFGTTASGGSGSACSWYGAAGCGTVFELTPPAAPGGAWTETILHSFTAQDGEGSLPGPLTLGADGVLYGPTWYGGTAGGGTVFALKP